jgi:hypothetical protein
MKDLVVMKNQWQAQPPPQLAEGVLAVVSALAVDVVSGAAALPPLAAAAAGADVPPEPPLKSVAYQPEPLS